MRYLLLLCLLWASTAHGQLRFSNELPSNHYFRKYGDFKKVKKKNYVKTVNLLNKKISNRLKVYLWKESKTIYIVGKINLNEYQSRPEICGTYDKYRNIIISTSRKCEVKNAPYYLIHEFSSIILKSRIRYFPKEKWNNFNLLSYDSDRKTKLENYNAYSTSSYRSKGFYIGYCKVSLEEDFNVIIGHYYQDSYWYKHDIRKYWRIKQKTKLAVDFFESFM